MGLQLRLFCCAAELMQFSVGHKNALILYSRSLPIRSEFGFMWGPMGFFMGFKWFFCCMFLTALRVALRLGVVQALLNLSRMAEEGVIY